MGEKAQEIEMEKEMESAGDARGSVMTWAEFKAKAEAEGLRDTDEFKLWYPMTECLLSWRDGEEVKVYANNNNGVFVILPECVGCPEVE